MNRADGVAPTPDVRDAFARVLWPFGSKRSKTAGGRTLRQQLGIGVLGSLIATAIWAALTESVIFLVALALVTLALAIANVAVGLVFVLTRERRAARRERALAERTRRELRAMVKQYQERIANVGPRYDGRAHSLEADPLRSPMPRPREEWQQHTPLPRPRVAWEQIRRRAQAASEATREMPTIKAA